MNLTTSEGGLLPRALRILMSLSGLGVVIAVGVVVAIGTLKTSPVAKGQEITAATIPEWLRRSATAPGPDFLKSYYIVDSEAAAEAVEDGARQAARDRLYNGLSELPATSYQVLVVRNPQEADAALHALSADMQERSEAGQLRSSVMDLRAGHSP